MDDMRVLHISDEAWQCLHETSTELGYDKRTSKHHHGFCDFIAFVLRKRLLDNRPDDIKAQDEELLAADIMPEWYIHTPRMRRSVRVTNDTLVQASIQAYRLGIACEPHVKRMFQPTVLDSVACLSRILEALGTGWLTYE